MVQTPAYRDDKLGTTLDTLPELLDGQRGARLSAVADGVTIDAPQALLVSSNPYGTGDIAGLGRRARLDRGVLGVVAVTVDSVGQAVGLLRGRHTTGLRVLTARTIVVTASSERIPVGIDGEAVSLPVPVRCAIRPGALRVRVPRDRPGVPPPKATDQLVPAAAPGVVAAPAGAGSRPRATRRSPRAIRTDPGRNPMPASYEQFTELRDVLARARELSVRTMIFDVEPLVAWWDSGQESLDRGVAAVVSELGELPDVRVVVFATNSARRPSAIPSLPGVQVTYLASAGKPVRTAPYRALPRPGAVIGDQVATDGLLARRLGYTFLHWNPRLAGVPLRPRLMGLLGRVAQPLFRTRKGPAREPRS